MKEDNKLALSHSYFLCTLGARDNCRGKTKSVI